MDQIGVKRKMNKRGQTLGIALMVAITLFIVGMLSINYIKPVVTIARDATHLDCANTADFPTGISDGTKLLCLTVDLVIPYFIIVIFSVTGGIITSRFLI